MPEHLVCPKTHPEHVAPDSIECALGFGPGSTRVCKNGKGCKYMHSLGNPPGKAQEGSSSSTTGYAAIRALLFAILALFPSRVPPTDIRPFDSTLGYPGEGPTRCMTWNGRGLCDRLVFADALRREKAGRVDVLGLQEHKWRSVENVRMAETCARVAEWDLYVSPSDGPRGGAALMVRKASEVKTRGDPCYRMDGRVVILPVSMAV